MYTRGLGSAVFRTSLGTRRVQERRCRIVYTHTDEAPALATGRCCRSSRAYAGAAGVEFELRDISLAGRILAQFPDRLDEQQRVARRPRRARRARQDARREHHQAPEHQRLGAADEGSDRRATAAGLPAPRLPRGPVGRRAARDPRPLRQGQGKRGQPGRCGRATPTAARRRRSRSTPSAHPQSMGEWSPESRSHVSTMSDGDFRSTERSVTVDADGEVRIEHVGDGRIGHRAEGRRSRCSPARCSTRP